MEKGGVAGVELRGELRRSGRGASVSQWHYRRVRGTVEVSALVGRHGMKGVEVREKLSRGG